MKYNGAMGERSVTRAFRGIRTMDGAGVSLTRVFGFGDTTAFDPFLLLDHFGSDDAQEYLAGFPWHPHRGIDTVTYMQKGKVRHGDSIGNSGVIEPGDLQWMTAGSGIIHEEMPQLSPGGLRGFQLWVNLSREEKMRDPAYRGFTAAEVKSKSLGGGEARILAGELDGVRGPVTGVSRIRPTSTCGSAQGVCSRSPRRKETRLSLTYTKEVSSAHASLWSMPGT